jgi:preprotein translocase subunit SecD
MKRLAAVGFAALALLLAGCGGSHRCSGSEVVFRASPQSRSQPITPQGMQLARQIMESRLQKLGVSSPTVSVRNGDELVVQGTGIRDVAATARLLGETGQLQLFDFEPSLAPPTVTANQQPSPQRSLYGLLKAVQKDAGKGSPEAYYLFKTSASHSVLQGPALNLHQLLLPYKAGKQPAHTQVLKVPANREPVQCAGIQNCPGASKSGESWYLLKLPSALSGDDFVESGITKTTDPNSGQPIVTLQFTHAGSQAFRRITKAEYDRGRINAGEAGQLPSTNRSLINQYAGHNAIVLDGQLEETPYIDYTDPTLSLGIVGNAEIFEPSAEVANRTALVLQSGSLPYTFKQVSRSNCPRQ